MARFLFFFTELTGTGLLVGDIVRFEISIQQYLMCVYRVPALP